MIIKDGIAYADSEAMVMTVIDVSVLDDYKLLITFSNNDTKIFDCKPLFKYPVYSHLKDISLFSKCYIELGIVSWDEKTDISTDTLYHNGVSIS